MDSSMKIVSLFSMIVVAVCLVGCGNPELDTCQQENSSLQGQLDQSQAAITERDKQIEALQAKNVEIQNKAMESITTMMTKQAAADEKLKNELTEAQTQIKKLENQNRVQQERIDELQKQVANHKCCVPE